MKILELTSINLDNNAFDFSFSALCKVMVIIASFFITLFLLFHAQYIWAFGFAVFSTACIHCYRLYQEIIEMDFNIEGAELTLEEIIEELG